MRHRTIPQNHSSGGLNRVGTTASLPKILFFLDGGVKGNLRFAERRGRRRLDETDGAVSEHDSSLTCKSLLRSVLGHGKRPGLDLAAGKQHSQVGFRSGRPGLRQADIDLHQPGETRCQAAEIHHRLFAELASAQE